MSFRRVAAYGGLVFSVLIVLTNVVLVPAGLPAPGSAPEEAIDFFERQGGTAAAVGALLPPAWLGSTLFASGVLLEVRRAGRPGAGEAGLGWALTGFAGVLLQNVTFAGVLAIRLALAKVAELDPATVEVVWSLHDALFTVNGAFLATALIGFSISGRTSRLVPPWHAVLGVVAGFLLLVSAALAPWAVRPGSSLGLVGLVGWLLWVVWLLGYAAHLLRAPGGPWDVRPAR